MKKALLLLVTAACLLSCGNGKNYPERVKQNFISGCTPKVKGNTALCTCVFEQLQQRYSFDEYANIEEKMKAGQTPPEFLRFIDSVSLVCYKKTKN